MDYSPLEDPQLRRMLREQRVVGREARLGARRAIRLCSPEGMRDSWRPFDAAQSRAVGASLGLRGGELCGCHTPRCDTCAANDGCGGQGCPICINYGYQAPTRLDRGGARSTAKADGSVAGSIIDVNVPIFDVHGHNFCASRRDWFRTRAPAGNPHGLATATENRVDRCYTLKEHGVEWMVLSSQADPTTDLLTADDTIVDNETLDEVTAWAADRHPDFFLPFVRGFDLGAEDAADYVDGWLTEGFVGVGELFVHAYANNDFTDNDALEEVCRTAALRGVPVQVHWNLGSVDGVWATSAADNYTQLKDLLDRFPALYMFGGQGQAMREAPLKLIIAHCGVGTSPSDLEDDDVAFRAYEGRIEWLLRAYPDVMFDLGGMQRDGERLAVKQLVNDEGPTTLGYFILSMIERYPTRFMIGIDAHNEAEAEYRDDAGEYQPGFEEYVSALSDYSTFLNAELSTGGRLDEDTVDAVRNGNAKALFGL